MTSIADLTDGMKGVDVRGEVVEGESEIRTIEKNGRTLRIAEVVLKDRTGIIPLTLWNEQIEEVKMGDRIVIINGHVNSFNHIKRLNIGFYGHVKVFK